MSGIEDVWIPLVDEPIGSIVAQIEEDEPDIRELVHTPRRLLAFKTFAYIKVGILLGQLLVDHDVEPYDGSETWIEALMRDPAHHAQVAAWRRRQALERTRERRPDLLTPEHLRELERLP